ncbi:MAG: hypothetical protein WCF50_30420 [Pseudolabrys sp.]|jgi:DNA-binding transcriptional regulator YdaS (Cro superfamily)
MNTLLLESDQRHATTASFSFAIARVKIADRRYRALGVEDINVGRPRATTTKRVRTVGRATRGRVSPSSSKPDARLVALARLLARQAARDFVQGTLDRRNLERD